MDEVRVSQFTIYTSEMNMKISACILTISIIFLSHDLPASNEGSEYVPVVGHNINVREKPDLKSKVIVKLALTEQVKVLERSSQVVTVAGKKGRWVYVDTPHYENSIKEITYKGWVFDYYLGYDYKFKKVKSWKVKTFGFCNGDYCPEFTFRKNGSFTYKYNLCYIQDCNRSRECLARGETGKGDFCSGTGHVYRLNEIIWFRIKNEKHIQYFILTKSGKLCKHPSACVGEF